MAASTKFLVEPRFRIRCGRRLLLGPGKVELLEKIQQTGSIAQAAKAMGMSYMRAWVLVRSLGQGSPEPLVEAARGGSARGGARLTATGRRVVALYREIEQRALAASAPAQRKLARALRG